MSPPNDILKIIPIGRHNRTGSGVSNCRNQMNAAGNFGGRIDPEFNQIKYAQSYKMLEDNELSTILGCRRGRVGSWAVVEYT